LAEGPEHKQDGAVLVIETNATHRAMLKEACQAAGLSVVAVSSVAEVERWPDGQIVITNAAHLTPWWRLVGAVEVIVLVQDAAAGIAALENGATRWLQPPPAAEVVAALVLALTRRGSSPDGGA
jgi:DNA-binding response OmpR family regulator